MKDQLLELVKKYPKTYSILLKKRKEYASLLAWLNDSLPLLRSPIFKISTKVNWILNDRTDFPTCKNCGAKFGLDTNLSLHKNYKEYCSLQCACKSEEHRQKMSRLLSNAFAKNHDAILRKRTVTTMNRYGVTNVNRLKSVRDKIKQTKLKRYGDANFVNVDKAKATLQNKGLKPFNPEKAKATNLAKYGDTCFNRTKFAHRHHRALVYYDNIAFDSKWEMMVAKYCKSHGIEYEYHPNIILKYSYDNHEHVYKPDFKIDGRLYEVKGDHFFDKDGHMQNPYDHSQDDKYKAKHQCMIENGVIIIKRKELDNLEELLKPCIR